MQTKLITLRYLSFINEYQKALTEELVTNKQLIYPRVHSKIIFRGQANHSHGLVPKLFRIGDVLYENELIRRYLKRFPEDRSKNQIEILTNMRHYGMPTRVLDWSENVLVALYFACEPNGAMIKEMGQFLNANLFLLRIIILQISGLKQVLLSLI